MTTMQARWAPLFCPNPGNYLWAMDYPTPPYRPSCTQFQDPHLSVLTSPSPAVVCHDRPSISPDRSAGRANHPSKCLLGRPHQIVSHLFLLTIQFILPSVCTATSSLRTTISTIFRLALPHMSILGFLCLGGRCCKKIQGSSRRATHQRNFVGSNRRYLTAMFNLTLLDLQQLRLPRLPGLPHHLSAKHRRQVYQSSQIHSLVGHQTIKAVYGMIIAQINFMDHNLQRQERLDLLQHHQWGPEAP